MTGLGLQPPLPMTGFAVAEPWIAANPAMLPRFLQALATADQRLVRQDAAWQPLRGLTGAENDAVFAALRDRFRQGVVEDWPAASRTQAARLFALLADFGDDGASALPRGTFWSGAAP
jgi:NitT/TauT family transport system substrate-binding protein